jgi:LuxR family maltose regulon positive regulatory protein
MFLTNYSFSRLDRNHVHRPHLLERLDQRRRRPSTLVSAPAGYGKSFLISYWLESCDIPSAWLSLDENDNDLRTFTAYFITAVETIFPGACRNTQALLNAPDLPPMAALATSLLNELDRIEQAFIMVFDDYHLIKETAVHNLLANILNHPPQSLHLVIVGRSDPPLPISTLRAQGQMTEIRTQDLRFTVAETATFFKLALGTQVDSATAIALEEKTEGWVTGLRLAALSMRRGGTLDPKLLEPHVDAQYVMEYLFTEVFSVQPPETSQYLMGTAILDRFCGPLCEAVCSPGVDPLTSEFGGWNFIAWLKRENLFLIPLDPENRWFRYHHLFQSLIFNQLKRHCSTKEINALHARASAWFAENGLIEEALQHALAGGDIPAAMQLVARHGHQLMNDQQWQRLTRWLDMLPHDRIEQDPEMLLLEAWIYHIQHNLSNVVACLKRVEALCSSSPPGTLANAKHIQGHVDALRGIQHYKSFDGENALVRLKRACENIPLHHIRARVFAHVFQLGAHQMLGDLAAGMSIYQEEMKACILRNRKYHSTYLTALGYIYERDADLIAMRQTAEHALIAAKRHPLPDRVPFVLYLLGAFHYYRNELKIAEEKLTEMVETHYTASPMNFAHSAFALALTYQAQRKPGEARKISEAVVAHCVETNNADMLQTARAFEAELALRQGRLGEALHWAKKFHTIPLRSTDRFYMPQLTRVKILLAQGTTDSRQAAADLLDQSLTFVRSIHNKRFQIDLLALQALLHDSQNNESAALKALTEALAVAEPGGFIRLFVDFGPRMADLLKRLLRQKVAVGYISRILAAFRDDARGALPIESDHPSSYSPSSSTQPLAEPLTNRELEILDLLAQRLSNKEIAAKLFISPETIKKHLNNIYGKLNVSGRRQAVDKAETLGILS